MIYFFILLYSSDLFSRSLEQAARNLDQKGTSLALFLAPVGIILAAVWLVLGKEEGKQKMSLAIIGAICIIGAKPIIKWLQEIF